MAIFWSLIPIANAVAFSKVPIAPLIEDGESGMNLQELLQNKMFWLLLIMMVCAGASEQSVSQWAYTLAEKSLGISKTIGDLGCSGGPTLVGFVSGALEDNLKMGILTAVIFPILLFVGVIKISKRRLE